MLKTLAPRVPAGYTEVEYVEAVGTNSASITVYKIDTGVAGSLDTEIETNIKHISSDPNLFTVVASNVNSSGGIILSHYSAGPAWAPKFGNIGFANKGNITLNTWQTVVMNKNELIVNGTSIGSIGATSVTDTSNIFIMCDIWTSPIPTETKLQMKDFIIRKSGVVVFNGIACKRNSDNIYGFYDTISKTFKGNSGTGTYTAGPEISSNLPKDIHELYKANSAGTGVEYIGELYKSNGQGGVDHIFSAGWDTTVTSIPATLSDARAKPTSWEIKGKSQQSRLPDGYTELEYVTSTGNSYIDTGFKGNQDSRIYSAFTLSEKNLAGYALFGGRHGGGNTAIAFWTYILANNVGRVDFYGSAVNNGLNPELNTKYTIHLVSKKWYINGNLVADTSTVQSFETPVNIYLGCMNSEDGGIQFGHRGAIYETELWQDGVNLSADFVPAKRNSDSMAGFYDLVSNTFKPSLATAFTAGPALPSPTSPVDVYGVGDYQLRPNQQFNISAKTTSTTIWGCTMTPNLTNGSIHLTGTGTISDFANSSGLSQWYPDGSMIVGHVYYVDMRGLEVGDSSPISIRLDGASRGFWTEPIVFTRGGAANFIFSWNIIKDRVYDTIFTPQIIDLTILYGAGNEPTTVAEFKQRLGVDEIPIYSYSATNVPYYKVPVKISGKNLLNPDSSTYISGTYKGSRIVSDNTKHAYLKLFDKDTSVDISGCYLGFTGNGIDTAEGITWIIQSGAINFMEKSNGRSSDTYYQFVSFYGTATAGGIDGAITKLFQRFDIMVVDGDMAPTSYEPYFTPTTSTINLSSPLHKISTYTDSIESDGTLTRGVGVVVFDGTENWSYESAYSRFVSPILPNCFVATSVRTVPGYCSHYRILDDARSIGNITIGDGYLFPHGHVSTERASLIVHDSHTSVVDFKAFLAAQYAAGTPVTVYYPLATDTETSIQVPTISTVKGTNYLDIQTEVEPSSVSITYRKRTSA